MPLWVILLGAGAIAWWWSSRQSTVAIQIPAGAAAYKVVPAGAPYYTNDPSLGTGLTGVAATPAGTLPAGTTVYATGASPVLSSDQMYEQIIVTTIGNVWVAINTITPA